MNNNTLWRLTAAEYNDSGFTGIPFHYIERKKKVLNKFQANYTYYSEILMYY